MPHPSLEHTAHRPWPMPARPWIYRQQWHDLLFAHWPVPGSVLAPYVPQPLQLQEREGTAWLGVIPFRMSGVSMRFLPEVPGLSAFPELNVRTYVEYEGVPGVWFLSLDAANKLAVWCARRFFHLPYVHARMRVIREGEAVAYESSRTGAGPQARFAGRYGARSIAREARPGTLEHWLVERYALYCKTPRGTLLRGQIHHVPWPIQDAWAEIEVNELPEVHRIPLDATHPPVLHFARAIDVVLWPFERAQV